MKYVVKNSLWRYNEYLHSIKYSKSISFEIPKTIGYTFRIAR